MDFKPCGTCNNDSTVEVVNVIPSCHCGQDTPPASPLSVTCPHLPINVSLLLWIVSGLCAVPYFT